MKLVIDIPEDAKIAFDNAESNDLKGCYYDHGGIIGNAIKNGKPLVDVIDKIREEIKQEITDKPMEMWDYIMGLIKAFEIIDKYKTESEDKDED